MLRHEGGAEPANLRILRAQGDSMELSVRDSDRLLDDVARKIPPPAGWPSSGTEPDSSRRVPSDLRKPRLRTLSCLAGEVRIAETVLWTVRRV